MIHTFQFQSVEQETIEGKHRNIDLERVGPVQDRHLKGRIRSAMQQNMLCCRVVGWIWVVYVCFTQFS